MSAALTIIAAGPGVTLQDAGRHGYLRYGVTAAGPMDRLAMATANLAVGAPEGATAIEVSLGGIELTADGVTLPIAVAGGHFDISLDGQRLPSAARLALTPGARLRIRAGADGAWCYVAVGGRIDVAPMLGSNATHTRSALGGIDGRGLAAGDVLPVRDFNACESGVVTLTTPWLARNGEPIRVILGPQDDYFSRAQIETFGREPWKISHRSDRMAYFLDGPPIVPANGLNVVSDGIVMGAIQVLGDGRPAVLMADRQVTGGYPKIATVIGPDLGRLAQLRPGSPVRFAVTTIDDAVAVRRAQRAMLQARIETTPLVRAPNAELLLGSNLISGVSGGD
ncbi:MAG TPA: biotin-dependent carboxyltransferase family protein [Xanthobacteraceae bacterium]|nr:biotin-dependent carboxyltransferase family protein [Xanthobacteraceae bacterium]